MTRPQIAFSRIPRRALLELGGTLLAAAPVAAQTRLYPPLPDWQIPRDGVKVSERGRRGMVAAAGETAARVGLEVLNSGGNAVDAAVAVGFALAVTMPEAGNLGGGMMLVYRSGGQSHAIDYREMLPAARPEQYANPLDRYFGVRSAGVPGTVAAFGIAHSRYGRKPWRQVLEPARRLAKDGAPLSRRMEETIAYAAVRMRDYPDAARLFLKSVGMPLREGHRFVQPELANTIARLRERGRD